MSGTEPTVALAVRRLGGDDLVAYKALRDHALSMFPEAFSSDAEGESRRTPDDYRSRLGLERPDGGHFLIGAFRGSALLGAIGCERESRVKLLHIGHVTGMMVRADGHRQGIGTALLEACIGAARTSRGVEMLTLSVTADNLAAVQLYQRHGFRRYGTLQRALKLGSTYVDKHQMVLVL